MLKCLWVRFFPVYVSVLSVFILISCDKVEKQKFSMLEQKCSVCHPLSVALNKNRDEEEWKRVIHGMKVRGLIITEDEERKILDYLKNNYGK